MNIAITVWKNRISPVFDSAQAILIVQTQGAEIVDAVLNGFQATMFHQFINLLQEQKVHVLICGALCEGPVTMLENQDIEVISFMTGEADKVLECYLQGKDMTAFSMPGCRRRRCCQSKDATSTEVVWKMADLK